MLKNGIELENKTKEYVTSTSEQKEGAIRDDDPEKKSNCQFIERTSEKQS